MRHRILWTGHCEPHARRSKRRLCIPCPPMMAQALYFKKEFTEFRVAADRAISLNPMDGATAAFMGMLIAYSGDWGGCALSDKGCQLNPNHPGCRAATQRGTILTGKRIIAKPWTWRSSSTLPRTITPMRCWPCATRNSAGWRRRARRCGTRLALKPNYAEVARELHRLWIQSDLVEQSTDEA